MIAAVLWAGPSWAQAIPACASRDTVLGSLAAKFSEVPVAVGIGNGGGLVEVLSSVEGDTWTIIITTPNGMSCLVAAGVGWRVLEPPELGELL